MEQGYVLEAARTPQGDLWILKDRFGKIVFSSHDKGDVLIEYDELVEASRKENLGRGNYDLD